MTCLIQCVDCGPRHLLAFDSLEQRGRWASEHRLATGHDEWRFCIDAPRTPADGLLFLISTVDDLEEVVDGRRVLDALWEAYEEIIRWQVAHNDAVRELIRAGARRIP